MLQTVQKIEATRTNRIRENSMSFFIPDKSSMSKRPGSRFQSRLPRMARVKEWRWKLLRIVSRQGDINSDGGKGTHE